MIAVTIVTYKAGFDKSCLLTIGDHEYITKDSCAFYALAKKIYGKQTEKLIANGTYLPAEPVSMDLLRRLRVGLVTSGDTAPFILEYAAKRGIR
jgi:hypothetical protein